VGPTASNYGARVVMGWLQAWEWAGVDAELGQPQRKWPTMTFFHFKFFFQLNRSEGVNKNRRNIWGPQQIAKFGMEIDLSIYHNFHIGHFDERSPIFK
jgi:hypothetical protein